MIESREKQGRVVLKESHCQYIDLCLLDTLADQGCSNGQKFVVKVFGGILFF